LRIVVIYEYIFFKRFGTRKNVPTGSCQCLVFTEKRKVGNPTRRDNNDIGTLRFNRTRLCVAAESNRYSLSFDLIE